MSRDTTWDQRIGPHLTSGLAGLDNLFGAPTQLTKCRRVKANHHFHREPCACHREVSGKALVAYSEFSR